MAPSDSRTDTPLAIPRSAICKRPMSKVRFGGRGILVHVEGTLCSRSYLQDVLHPYARRSVANFLRKYWFDESVACLREMLAREAGTANFTAWCKVDPCSAEAFVRFYDEVLQQLQKPTLSENMTELLEATWRDGCRRGDLVNPVYPDVLAALEAWTKAGLDVRTYSTLSVAGQRALLAWTEQGDLLPYLRHHYDGRLGPSWAPRSFSVVATDMGLTPRAVLFISDDPAELVRARTAGFTTLHIVRPGNSPLAAGTRYASIEDLRGVLVG